MRPLTLKTPKPLLRVAGRSLIEHHLIKLKAAGVEDVIINLAYLGEQICAQIGSGEAYGLNISYSLEPEPLETGGAINYALNRLGEAPFLLLNGDVWTDTSLAQLKQTPLDGSLAHLLVVNNPEHNPEGDFQFAQGSVLQWAGAASDVAPNYSYTYSGIAKVAPELIANYPHKRYKFPMREVFDWAIGQGQLKGEYYSGEWCDVGTPARLDALRKIHG